MSAMHHGPNHDSAICIYCFQDWPCVVARTRQELADVIRAMPDCLKGNYPYNCGHDDGREAAARLLDTEGQQS